MLRRPAPYCPRPDLFRAFPLGGGQFFCIAPALAPRPIPLRGSGRAQPIRRFYSLGFGPLGERLWWVD